MKTIRNDKGKETIIFAKAFETEAYEQVKRMKLRKGTFSSQKGEYSSFSF